MKRILSILIIPFVLCQCKTKKIETFVPPPIVELQPSWDGNKQDSGLRDYIDGKGFVLTPSAASRYTALTNKFGPSLTPPISAGQGLEPYGENFILSPEYMSVFMEVSRLNKTK